MKQQQSSINIESINVEFNKQLQKTTESMQCFWERKKKKKKNQLLINEKPLRVIY